MAEAKIKFFKFLLRQELLQLTWITCKEVDGEYKKEAAQWRSLPCMEGIRDQCGIDAAVSQLISSVVASISEQANRVYHVTSVHQVLPLLDTRHVYTLLTANTYPWYGHEVVTNPELDSIPEGTMLVCKQTPGVTCLFSADVCMSSDNSFDCIMHQHTIAQSVMKVVIGNA